VADSAHIDAAIEATTPPQAPSPWRIHPLISFRFHSLYSPGRIRGKRMANFRQLFFDCVTVMI
jgi:hypothetical protein